MEPSEILHRRIVDRSRRVTLRDDDAADSSKR